MSNNFQIPILLIAFNRPNHTRRVWEEIKKQKPGYLYVFQDGARVGNEEDTEKCAAVRTIFSEPLDWKCKLKTFYSDKNLGCGKGPVVGISWFFENVKHGIIMEDDCLPHPDFFSYCDNLLNRYKKQTEVMVVGATTYHDNYPCKESYLFSKYFTGGAWATWKRAWIEFSIDLENLDIKLFKNIIRNQFYSSTEINWWISKVKEIKADTKKKDYWDYQMQIHLLLKNGLTIRPQKNMISNIGFDPEGTHTIENDNRGDRKVYSCLPLTHPKQICVNKKNDYLFMAKVQKKRIDKFIISFVYQYMFNNNGIPNKLLHFYKNKKNNGNTSKNFIC
jgi:hypothetical protein